MGFLWALASSSLEARIALRLKGEPRRLRVEVHRHAQRAAEGVASVQREVFAVSPRAFRGLSLGLLLVAGSACVPSYSPPIRGLFPGMPDRLTKGQLELGGTAGGVVAPTTGGPHVSFALDDTLVLEAGGNANFVEGLWATLWAGARVIRTTHLSANVVLSGDFEFGFGGGVGGRDGAPAPLWFNRPTVGVYDGVGVGLRWKWLGAFARGRVDASIGLAPSTLWASALIGAEVRLGNVVVFSLGGGALSWKNASAGWIAFALYQAQLALHFDLAD